MTRTDELSRRLIAASRDELYDVYRRFEWTDRLDRDRYAMPPELLTLHGTPIWGDLSDEQRHRLSIAETANLFANTLHGEQALVAGLSERLYGAKLSDEITDYLHHFLDEENKHMVMFGVFCRKYVGRVYPDRSVAFPKMLAPGEDEIGFYAMAMVVEDFGDFYNVRTMKDDRCDALVREISLQHHMDESRHLAFDRAYLGELTERWLPQWDEAQRAKFAAWLRGFMEANWSLYYNPSAYKDAGIDEPYVARNLAMAHPAQVAHRTRVSAKLVRFFEKIGLLPATAEPDAA
ncbi:diiron oxygenase [Sandaracinus amylolyticus]|uniref:diiron oxygenase n=1 Tax=Sandaracinus amylolyticus TaxID=927083 RepID=UPI001F3BAA23|nr:diiron oxygenase [Sandaracinus amylolyticus]UJR87061.1 Hypothetical protein I5071_91620 [Sandaracinus amylolyticus]